MRAALEDIDLDDGAEPLSVEALPDPSDEDAELPAALAARAQRMRLAVAGLSMEQAARVYVAARMVPADSAHIPALAELKLYDGLSRRNADPRVVKLGLEYRSEERAASDLSTLRINLTPHRIADTSLSQIIAECPEFVLQEMADALMARLRVTAMREPVLGVLRQLCMELNEFFGFLVQRQPGRTR